MNLKTLETWNICSKCGTTPDASDEASDLMCLEGALFKNVTVLTTDS